MADTLTERDRDSVDFGPMAAQLRRLRARLGLDRPSGETLVLVGGCMVAVVLGLWLTSGAWGSGPPAGDDVTAYAIRTDFAIDNLISKFRVDGWHPGFMLGYQEFLFLGPGSTWIIALARGLTLGMLSTMGAIKVVSIASFVAVPLTVAFLATSLRLSRRAAGLAAILALAVNNPFGGGVQAIYNIGLIAQQVAVPFFFLALAGMVRLLWDPRPVWTVLTSVTVGALVVTHTPSLAVLGLVFAVIVVTSTLDITGPRRDALIRVGIAVAAGAALGACVLLPAYAHRDLQGPFIGWGTPPLGERLAQVYRGQFLFGPGLGPFVVLGMGYAALRAVRGLRFGVAVLATPLVYMVVAHSLQHEWPHSLVMQQLSNRGIGYAGILALLPLAALIGWATGTLDLGRVGDVAAVAIAAAMVVLTLGPTKDLAREMMVPVPQMREAAGVLAQVVPDHARFATQRDYPGEITRTNMIHPDRWLAWAAGKNTLNIFHATSSVAAGPAFETDHIVDRSPSDVATTLSRYGVTHLVTVSDPAAVQIGSSDRFIRVWQKSPLAIFALTPNPGQPDPSALTTADGPTNAKVVGAGPEQLIIDVIPSQAVLAQVALTWSPKWHARIDGRGVPVGRSAQGLVTVPVPAGEHRLILDFERDVWDRLGMSVTLVTIVLGAAWIWRGRSPRPVVGAPDPAGVP
jgi:hypothetical protein